MVTKVRKSSLDSTSVGLDIDINAASDKTTPVNADIFVLTDSASSFSLKKLSWLNIKTSISNYFKSTNNTFSVAQRGSITNLIDDVTITPDFNSNNFFSVTLSGNRTLANPTNLVEGQSGSIFITQDATGSRTLAYGSYWDFAGGTAPSLSTGANKVDRLDYVVKSPTEVHAQLTKDWS